MKIKSVFTSCVLLAAQLALTIKAPAAIAWTASPTGQSVQASSEFIQTTASRQYPGFQTISLDSLGKEKFPPVTIRPPSKSWKPVQATCNGPWLEYRRPGAPPSAPARWAIRVGRKEILLISRWSADDPPEPLAFDPENLRCHVTLLGVLGQGGSVQLPCLMHFPDQGSFRVSATPGGIHSLGYATDPGDMGENQSKVVKITFPPATPQVPVVTYRWEVVALHPTVSSAAADPRFDGFRRNWLNILQLSPHWGTLANHAASDTCAFCYYEYADIAERAPALAKGLTALDVVRQTLDRIIGGSNAYGMPGHGSFPEFSADTFPSLLSAAGTYVAGSKDLKWLSTNYSHLRAWAEQMLATDHDGNGLLEYSLSGNSGSWPAQLKFRPANWWDTIGFGHEDAYANALAYRALNSMAELAWLAHHPEDQARYQAAAKKLRAAYFDAFYNPATGVLAGWRSADGQLHDYYFLWVNGIAIHYGLVPRDKANAIMDRLLTKLKEVGYTRFDLGLPGNLIPVLRKDYVDLNPRFGGGQREDNTDGFERYENGGATACFAYFTLAALYDLGRVEEADRMLLPMLASFNAGSFQGRCSNGMSKDWKAWDGTCWGYEGFLADNYYALLAVLDRDAALQKRK